MIQNKTKKKDKIKNERRRREKTSDDLFNEKIKGISSCNRICVMVPSNENFKL